MGRWSRRHRCRGTRFNGAAVFTAEMVTSSKASTGAAKRRLQRGRGLHRGDGGAAVASDTALELLQRGRGLHRGDGRRLGRMGRLRARASTGPRSSPRRWTATPPPSTSSRTASTGPRSSPRRWLKVDLLLAVFGPLQRGRGLHRGDGRSPRPGKGRGQGASTGPRSSPRRWLPDERVAGRRGVRFNGAAVFTAEMGTERASTRRTSSSLQRGRGLHRGDGAREPTTRRRRSEASTGPRSSPRRWLRGVHERHRWGPASTGPRSSPRRWTSSRALYRTGSARFNGAAVFTAEMARFWSTRSSASRSFNGAAVFTAEMGGARDRVEVDRQELQRGRGLHRGDGCCGCPGISPAARLQRGRGLHRGDGEWRAGVGRQGVVASTGPRSSPRRWARCVGSPPPCSDRFNGAAVFTAEMAERHGQGSRGEAASTGPRSSPRRWRLLKDAQPLAVVASTGPRSSPRRWKGASEGRKEVCKASTGPRSSPRRW